MKKISVVAFTLLMTAAIASAQHGGGPRPGGPGGEGGPGGHAIVTSDGTIILNDDGTITAVRSTGTVAWTKTLTTEGPLVLSGVNLIQVSASRATDGTITSTLTAISTASGTTAWTKTFTGRVALEPFSGGTYALVSTAAARSLVGIGNDGSTLFTLAL